jgi:hypothetical protein
VALIRTDVWEERVASFIRVARICELRTNLTVINGCFFPIWQILSIPEMKTIRSSQTSVVTKLTLPHILEDGILHNEKLSFLLYKFSIKRHYYYYYYYYQLSVSVIGKDLFEIGVSVVGWFDLAQDRYRWKALINSVMNLRVP